MFVILVVIGCLFHSFAVLICGYYKHKRNELKSKITVYKITHYTSRDTRTSTDITQRKRTPYVTVKQSMSSHIMFL